MYLFVIRGHPADVDGFFEIPALDFDCSVTVDLGYYIRALVMEHD